MKLVDLNILLYAVNKDSAHHGVCLHWWEKSLAGREPVGLAWSVLLGFVRLATKRAFRAPLSPEEALDRVEAWLNHENTRVVQEGDSHFLIVRQLLAQSGTAGNLTTDAHLAALAIASGATLVSCDSDFARFQNLRWESPLATK